MSGCSKKSNCALLTAEGGACKHELAMSGCSKKSNCALLTAEGGACKHELAMSGCSKKRSVQILEVMRVLRDAAVTCKHAVHHATRA